MSIKVHKIILKPRRLKCLKMFQTTLACIADSKENSKKNIVQRWPNTEDRMRIYTFPDK